MLSLSLSRTIAATAALAFAAFGAASTAQARTDVTLSIGVQVPGASVYAGPGYLPRQHRYVQPRPVYVQPQQIYVQPAPYYVQPRTGYMHPRPVYVQPAPIYLQPRPVFIRPPMVGQHSGYGPSWNRGQWQRERGHGHHNQRGQRGHRGGDRD